MTKKIGRNDLCPCGSGNKYKRCCLGKTREEKYFKDIFDSAVGLKNEGREKHCIHPDHENCSGKIIKAHAIQNNRILKKIAENGEVITVDGQSNLIFQGTQTKGRKLATTFTGFCGHHDKVTFQDIEDREFVGSEKQVFLFTYRTLAWHYHKKLEQTNRERILRTRLFEKGYSFSEASPVIEYANALQMGMNDNQQELDDFNNALLDERYTLINYSIWEIPYEVDFAISMMHELGYDIKGNLINDLEKPDRPKSIYLNIFPAVGKTFCIWAWQSKWDQSYVPFIDQFNNLSDIEKMNYFNNNLPRWSDAIIISPRLWKKWGKEIQESFIAHANFEILYLQMEAETGKHHFEYAYTPWDLFEKIHDDKRPDSLAVSGLEAYGDNNS